jgi:arylsulfatase A-like enzyme
MNSRWLRGSLLATVVLLGACGAPPPRPNILIIVIDTLRRDHLSVYGYERPTSPQIDRLAADAVRYDAALSQAPWTLPSVAALLTGRDVAPLGIVDDVNHLDDEFLLISEILSEQDYSTGAIVSHRFVSGKWGFDQGYDRFDDSNALGHMAVTSPSISDKALAFLEQHQSNRFFLFLHYFDPHFSYLEHEDFRFERKAPYEGWIESGTRFKKLMEEQEQLTEADTNELKRLYDSEIAFTDHHIGRVLAWLRDRGLFDQTLIVLTSDHGEEFLEHTQIGHGKTMYEEVIGVPLIVRFPGGGASVVDRPVALVDVFPTILELLDLDPLGHLDGVSLLSADDAERFVFASTERRGGARGTRNARFKLIRHLVNGPELYDLEADPGERRNLLDPDDPGQALPTELERLQQALRTYSMRVGRSPQRMFRLELSPEERKQLEDLGYLSPVAP